MIGAVLEIKQLVLRAQHNFSYSLQGPPSGAALAPWQLSISSGDALDVHGELNLLCLAGSERCVSYMLNYGEYE